MNKKRIGYGLLLFCIGLFSLFSAYKNGALHDFAWFSNHTFLILGLAVMFNSRFWVFAELCIGFFSELTWCLEFFYRLFTGVDLWGSTAYMFTDTGINMLQLYSFSHILFVPMAIYALYLLGGPARGAWIGSIVHAALLFNVGMLIDPVFNVNCTHRSCLFEITQYWIVLPLIVLFHIFLVYFLVMFVYHYLMDIYTDRRVRTISVIIPTYKEEKTIVKTIEHLFAMALKNEYEIIVSDSSPDKKTKNALKKLKTSLRKKVIYVKSSKGRATQMNTGAAKAKNYVLLFLHSDTLLPKEWDRSIVKHTQFDYGFFYKQFDAPGLFYFINSHYTNIRGKFTSYLMGDHAIFVKKQVFEKIGGYADLSIMEDVDIGKRLSGRRMKVIKDHVITSARRFEKHGIVKTWYVMQKIKLGYALGFSDETLKKYYR